MVRAPSTSPRIWSGHEWVDSWKDWSRRNKAVLSEVVPRREFQNNIYRVFPAETYAKDHPEYYPLINGKRWIPPAGAEGLWRPCESNPEVRRLVVEYARKWFDEHPHNDSFSVGMDDIVHMCGCPGCRALDPHPDSYEKQQFSDRHYAFVNAIAREIAKTHPDRYIGTLIYAIARNLPEKVERLEPNVFGYITETSAAWWMPGRKEEDHELARQWARRCRHLSRYDYYGFASIAPRFYPHHMDEQIKFDKSLGFEGMYVEVYTFLPHTAPMIWALAKLQWDHNLKIDDLLAEFCAKMYGPAAPLMKSYFDLLERSYNVPRPGRGEWEHRNLVNQALAISPEDLDAGLALLRQAADNANDADIRKRLDVHLAALQYASYAVKAHSISQQLTRMAVTDEQSAVTALELVDRLSALAVDREAFWPAAGRRGDLLGETIRGLSAKSYLVTNQIASLEYGGPVGAMRAIGWYAEHAADRLPALAASLQGRAAGAVSDTVKAWLWVQQQEPQNLLANGGFEDRSPSTQATEKDWSAAGAPRGWSTWSSTSEARFAPAPGRGTSGGTAAGLTAAQNSACYLQSVRAQPRERYLVVCRLRMDPADQPSSPFLSVRFRDAHGAWHKREDLEPLVQVVAGVADWQPVMTLVTIPEGAGELVVLLGVRNQRPTDRVLYDDAAVYRLP